MITGIAILGGLLLRFLWVRTHKFMSPNSQLLTHIIVVLLFITSWFFYEAKPNEVPTFMSKLTQVASLYVCLIGSCLYWMYNKEEHWYDQYSTIPSIILFVVGVILLGKNFNFFVNFFIENDFVRVICVVSLVGITESIITTLDSHTSLKMN